MEIVIETDRGGAPFDFILRLITCKNTILFLFSFHFFFRLFLSVSYMKQCNFHLNGRKHEERQRTILNLKTYTGGDRSIDQLTEMPILFVMFSYVHARVHKLRFVC